MALMDLFTNLIQSVGFPIATVIYLFYYINKMNDKYEKQLKILSDSLNNNSKSLDNNTKIIQQFLMGGKNDI